MKIGKLIRDGNIRFDPHVTEDFIAETQSPRRNAENLGIHENLCDPQRAKYLPHAIGGTSLR